MSHSRSTARKRIGALFTSLATAFALVVPLAGSAAAAVGDAQPLNPDDGGPGSILSELDDGTDTTYHIVATVEGATNQTVDVTIDDGDGDDTVDFVVPLTRVAGTDAYEAHWDIPDAADPGAGTLTVRVNGGTEGSEAITISETAETVEITSPANGGTLKFFNRTASVSGTAHDDVGNVDVFYSTTAAGAEPVWKLCDNQVAVGGGNWSADCDLELGDAETDVTAVAARPDDNNDNVVDANESGDAHAVSGAVQTPTTLQVVPESDAQTQNFCNTYTATLTDNDGDPVIGANIDVHGVPTNATDNSLDDNWSFSVNNEDPDDADQTSDPFSAPSADGHDSFQDAWQCDSDEATRDAPEDLDDETAAVATADDPSAVGVHAAGTAPDTQHIEGSTNGEGTFAFSLAANTNVDLDLTVWYDADDDEALDGGELSDTASKDFQPVTTRTVDASPEEAVNDIDATHTIAASVTDQNDNPIGGEDLVFKITSGPNAGEDTDNDGGTPAGVLGQCTTDANGNCAASYGSDEQGQDTIVVFIDDDSDFVVDSGEPQDSVTKTWVDIAATGAACLDVEPNSAINGTPETHGVTAFVTDGTLGTDQDGVNDCEGNPVEGVPVDFIISEDDPDGALAPDVDGNDDVERVLTDADGMASVTLDNVNDAVGNNEITGSLPGVGEDDYNLTSTAYAFTDISQSGTFASAVSSCDDCTQDVVIPFAFNYFGVDETTVTISSNGFLTFDDTPDDECCSGEPFPTSGDTDAIIGGFWSDLDPTDNDPDGDLAGTQSEIYFETLGTAPNRIFVVQFETVEHNDNPDIGPSTFEFKLFESSNRIEVHYQDASNEGASSESASAGVENYDGSRGTQFFFEDVQNISTTAVAYQPGAINEVVTKDWATPGEPTDVECTPTTDVNEVGDTHALTATVTDALGDPVSGVNVDFQVTAGPAHANNDLDNDATTPAGWFGEGTTDASGQTMASFTGVDTGTDDITCFVDEPDDDSFDGDATDDVNTIVTKTWLAEGELEGGTIAIDMFAETGAPGVGDANEDVQAGDNAPHGAGTNTANCTADLGDFAIAESADDPDEDGDELPEGDAAVGDDWDTAHSGEVHHIELVCVSAKDASGNLLTGAQVTLTTSGAGAITDADGPPPEMESQTVAIDGDGYAEFYVHSHEAADQNVTASIEGMTDTATGTKTWTAGPATQLDLQPDTAINAPGDVHQVTATVADQFGNPVEGVAVDFSETGVGRFTNGTSQVQDVMTNADGQATAETTTQDGEEGRQQITAQVDEANSSAATDCGAEGASCSDTVEKIWGAQIDALEPTTQTVTAGQQVCLPIQVLDTNGDPVEGVEVDAELTGANVDEPITGQTGPCDGTTQQSTATATTDADGIASFVYTPQNTGTDTVTIWADFDGDDTLDDGEPSVVYTLTVEGAQPADNTVRFAGEDRMETAVLASQNLFGDGEASAVVVARSDRFPDALAGSPLAVANDAPLLLTPSPENWAARGETDHLHPTTEAEIERVLMDGGTVYILGQTAAIGTATADDIEALAPVDNVVRLGGADRFETAIDIANQLDTSPDTIFVTTGRKFPDALSAGAAAAQTGAVIVLTDEDEDGDGEQNPDTTEYLLTHQDATMWAIGGPAAEAYPAITNTIVGESRLGTAVGVANQFFTDPTVAGIARADEFPDALSGGTHIGHLGGPLLLTNRADLNAGWGSLNSNAGDVADYLTDNAASIATAYLYGGTAAISGTVDAQVQDAITE